MSKPTSCCFVEFDGVVTAQVKADLVSELVKYVVYQRQQIPQAFDQLKQHANALENQDAENVDGQVNTRRKGPTKLQTRKCLDAVKCLDDVIGNIKQVFSQVDHIHRLALVLGPTPISPKETFIIQLPSGSFDGYIFTSKEAVRQLFRTIVAQDILGNCKSLSPTNLHVLLLAPRDCDMKWFLPNPSYKIPSRGKLFELSIVSKQSSNVLETDLTVDATGSEFEMSGIALLEESAVSCDTSEDTLCNSINELSLAEHNDDVAMTTAESPGTCSDSDLIWYQAPVAVKGFRDKTSKSASCMDIWG